MDSIRIFTSQALEPDGQEHVKPLWIQIPIAKAMSNVECRIMPGKRLPSKQQKGLLAGGEQE